MGNSVSHDFFEAYNTGEKRDFMKKIIIILLIFILILFCFKLRNSDKKNNNKIKLGEVTHSIFYAPLYVALENGYFKDEGLEVELSLISGADKVSAAVLSGDVEIGFAGAESAIYIYNSGEKDYLQIFSGLTKRDGQFIVGKNNDNNFTLDKLKGKEILVGRKGGMPALNFLNAIHKAGIKDNEIKINYQIDFASLTGAFVGGTGDYVNLFEPNASLIEKNNQGYVLASIGKYSGEMPYTTFYAKKSYIKNNKDITKKFSKAITKGLKYVHSHSALETAKVIKKQFPDNSIKDLEIMIQNYLDADSWLNSSYIDEKIFINLEDLLIENKLIDNYIPFNNLVINYEK